MLSCCLIAGDIEQLDGLKIADETEETQSQEDAKITLRVLTYPQHDCYAPESFLSISQS
jgi:hypothetical protein